jgi:nickel/cobalt exporter
MTSFSDLIQQGSSHAWLFIPSAILLGILHGLEPGHSKTMMAAFIVAIRGTVRQAFLLGVMATISHTAIVWAIGLGGMYLWHGVAAERLEPYFQLASGIIIILVAAWMFRRTWRDESLAATHTHDHAHSHDHADEDRRIDTGHGVVLVKIVEVNGLPYWGLVSESGPTWKPGEVSMKTERPDGKTQRYAFISRNGKIQSLEPIAEPHEFMVRVDLRHGSHSHSYDVSYIEPDAGKTDHLHEEIRGLDVTTGEYQDAHSLAHANDIRRRFANREVTNKQIALFGLTGGLIPCPASITVLLLCLQLKEYAVGAVLVLCFSIGLAITLVSVGAIAALSVRHVTKRFGWISVMAQKAPYLSSALMIVIGVYVILSGLNGINTAA